jgi:hypothetical protein
MMQQVLQGNPHLINMIGDIFFRNSDMAGSDQLADRFRKMLPPNLQNDDDPVPPQAQAAIAHAQQQMGLMQAELSKFTMERDAKVLEHKGKMEEIQAKALADMALEDKKLLASVTIAEINTKAQNAADREADRRALEAQFHDQAHDAAMQAQSAQQSQQAQQQAAALQSQQSAQDSQQQQAAQPEPNAQPANAE